MRLSCATTLILFLSAAGVLSVRPAWAEGSPAVETPPAPEQGGVDPSGTHPEEPADPPAPPVDEVPEEEEPVLPAPPEPAPEPPANVLPGTHGPVAPRAADEVRAHAPTKPVEEDTPELKLPDDAPPSSDNELTAELGWNSDSPVGLRYLRRIEGTPVSFGLGLGLVTMWGPKLSAIVRLQTSFEKGLFAQVSAGYSLGGEFTQKVTPKGGQPQTAHLLRTPSRTADVMVGWRLPIASNFLEASAGYSFNLQGTVLQQQVVDGHPNQPLMAVDLNDVPFNKAGGIAGAVSYGWLF